MCMIGDRIETLTIPRAKARLGYRTHRSSTYVNYAPLHGRNYKVGFDYRAHRAPAFGGKTGFWCYRRRVDAAERFSSDLYRIIAVRVWGRVVRHKYGYRAQYMRRVS